MDTYLEKLERAFDGARHRAEGYAQCYNELLPTDHCPSCKAPGHVPGLACPCGYTHPKAYAIVKGSEYGSVVVPLTNQRRRILARFDIDENKL